jgi:hypothetical protein
MTMRLSDYAKRIRMSFAVEDNAEAPYVKKPRKLARPFFGEFIAARAT